MATKEQRQAYPDEKVKVVKELSELMNKYNVIGLANLQGISSSVIQDIRGSLRGKTILRVSKNTLKRLAIDNVAKKPGAEKLKEYINGSIALVFSNENPFKLQKFLMANTVLSAARVGQIAPVDVEVPAGATDLNPGPVIGELNRVGIRTKVEKGKIAITTNATIIKQGEKVTEDISSVLNRLNIKPFPVGLTLTAAYDNGTIFLSKDLQIDIVGIQNQLLQANQFAMSLAFAAKYISPLTIRPMLQKAHSELLSLSMKTGYATKDNINLLLAKAHSEAAALEAKMPAA